MTALTPEQIAHVAHEANRAYQVATGEPNPDPHWEDLEGDRRKILMEVDDTVGELSAELQHEKWLADKAAAGWVYGPVKDAVAKTHPCIVPYAELSDLEKRKDALFAAVVRALRERV